MFTFCSYKLENIDTLEFYLKLFGSGGAAILFIIGLIRYYRSQKWKRLEFIAKEMKVFNEDHMVQNVMHILDFGAREIELFPEHPIYEERFVYVDQDLLERALVFHKTLEKQNNKVLFTKNELAIRDHFDCFFSYFERFEHFLSSELVNVDELKPYLEYWIIAIADGCDEELKKLLLKFVDEYKFQGTQKLFIRFGKNIQISGMASMPNYLKLLPVFYYDIRSENR